MILKTLNLKNYRRFKEVNIEFPDGIIGVIGLNGVGKSTIFEAVAWALYGSPAARTSIDQIKRNGASPREPCRVELEFIFEGNAYKVIREMTGKTLSPSAIAFMNSKIMAQGAGAVTSFIQKTLGMDFKSFFTSVFAKQKELNALSNMNASERRPLILRMLGIDALDEVIREINIDRKTKKTLVDRLSITLLDQKTGRSKIEILSEKIKEFEKKKEDINIDISRLKEIVEGEKEEIKEISTLVDEERRNYEEINKEYQRLIEEKTRYNSYQELKKNTIEIKQRMEERNKQLETLKRKILKFQGISDEIQKTIERLEKIEEERTSLLKIIEQKKTIVKEYDKTIRELTRKRGKIEKMGPDASCPTCERILGEQYHILLEKYREEIEEKTSEEMKLQREIQIEEENYERIKKEKSALERKKEYLQQQSKEKEKLETMINQIDGEIQREKRDYMEKHRKLQQLEGVTFDPEEYKNIQEKMKESYQKYQNILKTLNRKREDLSKNRVKLEKTEGSLKLVEREINNLEEKIRELEDTKKRISSEQKETQRLNILYEIMTSFRSSLISRIRPALSEYATDFFRDLTDGKYQEIELDENYNILIYDRGKPYLINRFSGGEEDLANLCLRLAISEVITERSGGVFNLIILDEIFGSQDMIRQQNILRALNTLSSKFRQIFLITHVEELKNSMQHILYVYEDGDISKIELQ